MLRKNWSKLYTFFIKLPESIAFLPSLICLSTFSLAFFLLSFQNKELDYFILKTSLIKFHSLDTLRSLLTTFLTGLISMTIFSFSMVMLVLSQAASHYSPKILNWMVGKRSNQYILGVYLGTIIFILTLLLQLPKDPDLKPSYHFALVVAAFLTFYSLILFVSFINNVSTDIQISKIIESIYHQTKRKLKKENLQKPISDKVLDNSIEWFEQNSTEAGYLQQIRKKDLLEILHKYDLKIKIMQNFGYFHIQDNPLYSLNKRIADKELLESISATFLFYSGERIADHTFYGFRQLSEIAVKALSPGINDPGTAASCIDYLTNLFVLKMDDSRPQIIQDKEGVDRIFLQTYSFHELLDICFIPILQYARSDIKTLGHLLMSVKKMARKDKERQYQKLLNKFAQAIWEEVKKYNENKYFFEYLLEEKRELETIDKNYFSFQD